MNKNKINKTEDNKNNKKSIFNNLMNYKNRKYIVGTVLGVMLFTLTLTFTSSSVVNKSYALGTAYSWDGYYTDTNKDHIHDQSKASYKGYFYINVFKGTGNTPFKSATYMIKATEECTTCKNAHALYEYYVDNISSWTFSKSSGASDSNKWIKVANENSALKYETRRSGIVGTENDGHRLYIAPHIRFHIPKGYYFGDYSTGYDKASFNTNTALVALYCSTSPYGLIDAPTFDRTKCYTGNKFGEMLFSDTKSIGSSTASMSFTSAPNDDTWTNVGWLQMNLISTRALTREATKGTYKGKHIRSSQSYSVRFLPNKTTIKYDANGGSGAPASQTKTYDSKLNISSTKPTRENYIFTKWCSKSDGSGTCYSSNQLLDATIWPSPASTPSKTNTVTLYAQWIKKDIPAGEWCGYSVDAIGYKSPALGWQNGYGYIHLGKCGVDASDIQECEAYSTNEIKSIYNYSDSSTQSAEYLNYINNNASESKFSIIAGDTSYFNFVDQDPKVTSSKTSFNGNSVGTFVYMNGPKIKIKPPKGYKYWTYASPYPNTLWNNANTEFSFRKTDGSGTHLLALVDKPGPYNGDDWIEGTLTLNNASIGHRTYYGYRVYKAQCIAFKPNTRTFSYNANGGTGTVDNTRYVYGESEEESGMTVADNGFTKSGYVFTEWNTKADGSGESFEVGQSIPENRWPEDSSDVTLYAQWAKVNTAKIYFIETDENDKFVTEATTECTVESGNTCEASLPNVVTDSTGENGNEYAGLASTTGTMDTIVGSDKSSITLSDNMELYAVYRTVVKNYYENP